MKYHNGVATSIAAAKRQKIKPLVNASLYKSYVKLDKNRDGTVCEKASSSPSTTVATTVPFVAPTTVLATATTVAAGTSTTTTTVPGSFGSGVKAIGGSGVTPGRYMTFTAASCYWARLSGFGGTLDEILANSNPGGSHVIVDISPADVGFSSSRCGTWLPYNAKTPLSISEGVWSIGDEMQAGTWSATFTTACYWARLSGFGGTLDEILANANPTSWAIVQIQQGDVGFLSKRCGTWTKIG
jgi:hypothetical protein